MPMNNTMQAVWISTYGGPEVLEIRTVGKPLINDDQVLVRVRASSLNRADLLQRQGKYPPPPGFPAEIPGMEFAGEVAEVGSSVRRWKPGQRVFGLIGGGAHAEYVVTYEHLLAEIPANLDWAQAAAVPEVFITAHDALWTQANLRPGETVLIHAVGSGVGLAAVQLARAIQAVPYGTSRTADKIEQVKTAGIGSRGFSCAITLTTSQPPQKNGQPARASMSCLISSAARTSRPARKPWPTKAA